MVDLGEPGPGHELIAPLELVLTGLDRAEVGPHGHPHSGELAEQLLRVFDAQAGSRWLGVAARRLGLPGGLGRPWGPLGAGTALAVALRIDDPVLLSRPSPAFHLARRAQSQPTSCLVSGVGPGLRELTAALVAGSPAYDGADRPRRMPTVVLARQRTLAGHLPRAVGISWALGRHRTLPDRLRGGLPWPQDAVVVAGFDPDAAHHSTAAGVIDTACWSAMRRVPLPLLLVCLPDGSEVAAGGSRGAPGAWPAAAYAAREGLEYRRADGGDPLASLQAAASAAALVRQQTRPALLQLTVTGDLPGDRTSPDCDPLAATMLALVDGGVLSAQQVRARWSSIRDETAGCLEEAVFRASTDRRGMGMYPPGGRRASRVALRVAEVAPDRERRRVFDTLPEAGPALTLAQAINRTLRDAGANVPGLVVLGHRVAAADEAHEVTRGLRRWLGASRVIDTVPDEQTIMGMAVGAAISGLLPVAEIAGLAGVRAAEDQLREAVSLQAASGGGGRAAVVVRVPISGRLDGLGGVGRDDTSLAALRAVSGLVIASPAHPSDAPAILRTCLAAARTDGTVSVVIEPVDLYHERDMLTPGDGAWLAAYAPPAVWEMAHVPIGRAATWGTGGDLTVATFGTGLRTCLRAADRLAAGGTRARVVDLRWLAPLPIEDVLREARVTGRLLIVDDAPRGGGVAEGLITGLIEAGYRGRMARLSPDDEYPAQVTPVSEADVEDAARALLD